LSNISDEPFQATPRNTSNATNNPHGIITEQPNSIAFNYYNNANSWSSTSNLGSNQQQRSVTPVNVAPSITANLSGTQYHDHQVRLKRGNNSVFQKQ
jgi:hypothetical protein